MKSIIIYSFMTNQLKLRGVELLLYALIYSFTQFGCGCCASVDVICEFLGCSRSQFFKAKKELISLKLVVASDKYMFTLHSEQKDPEKFEDLEEAIRLAKVPWLD